MARHRTGSEVTASGQTHEVTLLIDGKVVAKWTTTGKVEVNGTTYTDDANVPMAPAMAEKPQ